MEIFDKWPKSTADTQMWRGRTPLMYLLDCTESISLMGTHDTLRRLKQEMKINDKEQRKQSRWGLGVSRGI